MLKRFFLVSLVAAGMGGFGGAALHAGEAVDAGRGLNTAPNTGGADNETAPAQPPEENASISPSPAQLLAIPEPSISILVAVGGFFYLLRWRPSRH